MSVLKLSIFVDLLPKFLVVFQLVILQVPIVEHFHLVWMMDRDAIEKGTHSFQVLKILSLRMNLSRAFNHQIYSQLSVSLKIIQTPMNHPRKREKQHCPHFPHIFPTISSDLSYQRGQNYYIRSKSSEQYWNIRAGLRQWKMPWRFNLTWIIGLVLDIKTGLDCWSTPYVLDLVCVIRMYFEPSDWYTWSKQSVNIRADSEYCNCPRKTKKVWVIIRVELLN